jgi:Spy/CpxP family protein refolding chaperone
MTTIGVIGGATTKRSRRPVNRDLFAAIVLLLVGGAGIAIGVAVDRLVLYRHYGAAWTMEAPSSGAGQAIARQLARELDLTPAQQAKVDSIIARQMVAYDSLRREYQPRVQALMLATRAAIDSILTPPQRERLRAMSRTRDQT